MLCRFQLQLYHRPMKHTHQSECHICVGHVSDLDACPIRLRHFGVMLDFKNPKASLF